MRSCLIVHHSGGNCLFKSIKFRATEMSFMRSTTALAFGLLMTAPVLARRPIRSASRSTWRASIQDQRARRDGHHR